MCRHLLECWLCLLQKRKNSQWSEASLTMNHLWLPRGTTNDLMLNHLWLPRDTANDLTMNHLWLPRGTTNDLQLVVILKEKISLMVMNFCLPREETMIHGWWRSTCDCLLMKPMIRDHSGYDLHVMIYMSWSTCHCPEERPFFYNFSECFNHINGYDLQYMYFMCFYASVCVPCVSLHALISYAWLAVIMLTYHTNIEWPQHGSQFLLSVSSGVQGVGGLPPDWHL